MRQDRHPLEVLVLTDDEAVKLLTNVELYLGLAEDNGTGSVFNEDVIALDIGDDGVVEHQGVLDSHHTAVEFLERSDVASQVESVLILGREGEAVEIQRRHGGRQQIAVAGSDRNLDRVEFLLEVGEVLHSLAVLGDVQLLLRLLLGIDGQRTGLCSLELVIVTFNLCGEVLLLITLADGLDLGHDGSIFGNGHHDACQHLRVASLQRFAFLDDVNHIVGDRSHILLQ